LPYRLWPPRLALLPMRYAYMRIYRRKDRASARLEWLAAALAGSQVTFDLRFSPGLTPKIRSVASSPGLAPVIEICSHV
jgi:hypothetical protein